MATYRARVLTPVSPEAVRFISDAIVVVDEHGRLQVVDQYDGRPVDEDLRAGILTPGFVDAHVHYPQTRVIGRASGPLLDWLDRTVFPEEARFAQPGHAARVAAFFCGRLAAAGTTSSLIYSSVHPHACDTLFSALHDHGLRAIAGPVLMDLGAPPPLLLDPGAATRGLDELRARWHGADGRLSLAVLPRFALSCSARMLAFAGRYADEHGLLTSTHIAENEEECARVRERFHTDSYLDVYAGAGLIRAGTVLAHCIHLSETEFRRMVELGAVIAHCPDSNAFLGSGSLPIDRVLAHGLPIALGSDVAAGRSFRIPAAASAAFDNGLRVGTRLEPARLLWWATRGGALAIGHDNVGELRVGLAADMVLHTVPDWIEDQDQSLAAILFDLDGVHVSRTWVRGAVIWSHATH